MINLLKTRRQNAECLVYDSSSDSVSYCSDNNGLDCDWEELREFNDLAASNAAAFWARAAGMLFSLRLICLEENSEFMWLYLAVGESQGLARGERIVPSRGEPLLFRGDCRLRKGDCLFGCKGDCLLVAGWAGAPIPGDILLVLRSVADGMCA